MAKKSNTKKVEKKLKPNSKNNKLKKPAKSDKSKTNSKSSTNKKPVSRSKVKDKIISKSIEIMLIKGYEASSLDEICQETEVSKGNLFYHIKNKENLAKLALDKYYQNQIEAKIEKSRQSKNKIFTYIDLLKKDFNNKEISKSSLLGTLAQEVSETHPRLSEKCKELYEKWIQSVKSLIDQLVEKQNKINTQQLAFQLVSILEGSLLINKVTPQNELVINALDQYENYIQALIEGLNGYDNLSNNKQKPKTQTQQNEKKGFLFEILSWVTKALGTLLILLGLSTAFRLVIDPETTNNLIIRNLFFWYRFPAIFEILAGSIYLVWGIYLWIASYNLKKNLVIIDLTIIFGFLQYLTFLAFALANAQLLELIVSYSLNFIFAILLLILRLTIKFRSE